jgi:hypothetical protein
MKINNCIEFFHFVRSNGLVNMHPEVNAFSRCVEEYGRMCPCDPQAAREAKINQCKAIYLNFMHRAPQFRDLFLSKVSDVSVDFCNDGHSLLTLRR